jgi:hypothetical protein
MDEDGGATYSDERDGPMFSEISFPLDVVCSASIPVRLADDFREAVMAEGTCDGRPAPESEAEALAPTSWHVSACVALPDDKSCEVRVSVPIRRTVRRPGS